MRKVLLSLCCVLAAVSLCAAGEDFYKLGSLENRITAGGFSNEIDDQFSAGSAFGSYDRHLTVILSTAAWVTPVPEQ